MLQDETKYSLPEACRRAGYSTRHLSTLLRWASRGINGVRLETVVLGGRRQTSPEAFHRFEAATTEARDGALQPMPTPRQSERAAAKAAKTLADRLAKS